MLTDQEIYDRVCVHLFNQGQRAYDSDASIYGTCMYRTKDGLKCAVGCLIEDDEYSKNFEGDNVRGILGKGTLSTFKNFSWENVVILKSLQELHDNVASWTSELALRTALIEVGTEFNLDCSKVSGLSFNTVK